MGRVRLLVAYDGEPFRGFAANVGVRTVAGDLSAALERVLGVEVALSCAGRTDAGVHAVGQVVTFDVAGPVDLDRLVQSVNRLCSPSIAVREPAMVSGAFDARFSAISRRYRYTVLNREVPDPLLHRYAWHVTAPLDLAAMNRGCRHLVGEHDFASFCRRREVTDPDTGDRVEASLVRHVRRAEWSAGSEGVLRFDIEAGSFCHQMVRSIVGLLVDVGRGRRDEAAVAHALEARDRHAAGSVAPPHGLVLRAVGYPDDPSALR